MSSLKEHSALILDWAKYGKAFGAGDLGTPPVCLLRTLGNGRAIKTYLSDKHLDTLHISLERKIVKSDVLNGQLIPTTREGVKRRGGKRYTEFPIKLDTAEQLHKQLGEAIREAKKRKEKVAARKRLSNFFRRFSYYTYQAFSQKAA